MKTGLPHVLDKVKFLFVPYLALLAVCLSIKVSYDRQTVYYAINAIHSAWFDYLSPYVTDAGDGLTMVVLTILLLLFNYRKAFLLFSSYLLTSIAAQALKHSVNMPRPGTYFKDKPAGIYLVKGIYIIGGIQSFPSGHTVTAFSAAVAITYFLKDKAWGIPLLIAAVLVGYSRIYLSEHFFEDVTAGSVTGTFITLFWLSYIDNKHFLASPGWNRGLLKS